MNQQTIRIVTIVICLMLLGSGGWNAITLSSQGYTTGYQGAKAQFYGIVWNDAFGKSGKKTFTLKGTTMNFDPDEPEKGTCNLVGEMTAVLLPKGSNPIPSDWGSNIQDWWNTPTKYIQNPIRHYEWKIRDEEKNETVLYAMEEYNLKWYFSISADWSSGVEHDDRRFLDTQVWFQFDLAPIWYFEGADTTYFSIAEIRISDFALGGKLGDDRENVDEPTEPCRVVPMSEGSIIPIYYNAYGLESDRAEKEAYEYQGKKLNPDLFTDKVYSYFTLINFGTDTWEEGLSFWKEIKYKGDVVTVGFDFHVFVVGEWTVKDIQDIPEEYGRTAQVGSESTFWYNLLTNIGGVFSNPAFMTWFFIGLVALFFLVIAIFAPWLLFAIIGMAGSLRKGKKKGGG